MIPMPILLALHLGAFHLLSGLLPIIPNAGVVHTAIDYFAKSGHSLSVAIGAGLFAFGLTIQEILDKKAGLVAQANEVLAAMGDQPKAEDEARFDAMHVDIEKLTKQAERMRKQEATEASLTDTQGRRADPNPTDRGSGGSRFAGTPTERDKGEALRAWMTAGAPGAELTDSQRDNARRCGINLESKRMTIQLGPALQPTLEMPGRGLKVSEEDLRSWKAKLTEERVALTGLQSTTTTGGYTVPDATMQSLEVALLAYGGMRSVATVIRTATGGPLPIPTTNDTANKGEIIGENTTSNELEMTFGQLVLDAWKYSSKYILASIEFLQDTSINAPEFLGAALGTRIARITNDHFTTGTGSQPNGIVTAATSSAITLAGTNTVTYDNLVDLVHSVDPEYRVNSRFMFHDGGLKMIKKVKVLQYSGDTSGYPLWQAGLTAGQPDLIMGYPYTINQSMTTPATTVKSILFGQLNKYLIRDVRDVTVVRLDELFAVLGQVAFLALSRHDGDLLDAGTRPVKYATQA